MNYRGFMRLFCFIGLFFYSTSIYAYSTGVHIKITEEVIKQNQIDLDKSVNDYLGITEGVEKTVNSKTIKDWIKAGSWQEDIALDILTSHFYNPLTNNGLSVNGEVIGESAYDRANDSQNQWSWKSARDYLYQGLTSNTKAFGQDPKVLRESFLSSSFLALGHVVHLVEDMAVPAHTRDDQHMPVKDPELYEGYTGSHISDMSTKGYFKAEPFQYGNVSLSSGAPRQFWDSDLYDGTDPSVTMLLPGLTDSNLMAGLAEYTNANFFSKDTMYKGFPHPYVSLEDFGLLPFTVITLQGNISHKTFYISGYGKTHLAAFKYFGEELWKLSLPIKKYQLGLFLDNRCHDEYARNLLPRAVGYSSGLLNYFFRGTFEITPPDQYVYSIIDGSSSPQQFTKIKAKIKNTTPNDVMLAGTITAVAKYKKRTDYESDLSGDPPGLDSMEPDYSYSVSATRGLMSEELATLNVAPMEFTFDFTADPIPAGVTDLSLQIVFKGTLGNEKDNAIAVGYKDLMEPTHLVFWNLTDRFSILDPRDSKYHLKTGDEIRAVTELRDIVNESPAAIIDPYDINYEIAFSGSASPAVPPVTSARVKLQAGNYARLIVLADNPRNVSQRSLNYLKLTMTHTIDQWTDSSMTSFLGAYNQDTLTDNGVIFYYTPIDTFRTINQHFYTGYLRCRPVQKYPSGESYCPYNEAEVTTPPDLAPTPVEITFE